MSPNVFAEGRRGHGRLKSLRGDGLRSSVLDFRFSFGKYIMQHINVSVNVTPEAPYLKCITGFIGVSIYIDRIKSHCYTSRR